MKNESVFSIDLVLSPNSDATLPAAEGHLPQAAFLSLISRFDLALSTRLHDEPNYRPYTISPIRGGKLSGDTIILRRGQPCHLRITLLDGGMLWHALQTYIQAAGPIFVRLGRTDFRLTAMFVSPATSPTSWVGSADWQTLATLPAQSTITLHFETATAFSLGDRQFGLFPEPRFVWASLLRVWNKYAPERVHFEKQILRESLGEHIAVVACALHHAYLHFPRHTQKGFVGQCTYRLSAGRPLVAQLTSLAAFAHYAGVGYKTTMGMGQVRVEFGEAPSD